jgi:hypothetical protein
LASGLIHFAIAMKSGRVENGGGTPGGIMT